KLVASFVFAKGNQGIERRLPWKFRLKGAKGVSTSVSISANFAKHRKNVISRGGSSSSKQRQRRSTSSCNNRNAIIEGAQTIISATESARNAYAK
ncbi:hypothetical protein ALC53_13907, partial [Atta colombica]